VRLAVSNALWPMIWPTPSEMTTQLSLGGADGSRLVLPVIPHEARPGPDFADPEPSTEAAGVWTIQSGVFPENAASLALHRADYVCKRPTWSLKRKAQDLIEDRGGTEGGPPGARVAHPHRDGHGRRRRLHLPEEAGEVAREVVEVAARRHDIDEAEQRGLQLGVHCRRVDQSLIGPARSPSQTPPLRHFFEFVGVKGRIERPPSPVHAYLDYDPQFARAGRHDPQDGPLVARPEFAHPPAGYQPDSVTDAKRGAHRTLPRTD
jgi:hypothetical protein